MSMASIAKSPPFMHRHSNPTSVSSSPLILSLPFHKTTSLRLRVSALRSEGDNSGRKESYGSNLLRKPVISSTSRDKEEGGEGESEDEEEEEEEKWIDWEDKILEDTVPLVGFVRMLLHSGTYESGARLKPEHERTIVERLLPYHPESEKKIGCGIDYITVKSLMHQQDVAKETNLGGCKMLLPPIGYHPEFEGSRCLFVVRKDGEFVDFSYWKCIKGLIRKNYPLYADSFILRHFRRHRQNG